MVSNVPGFPSLFIWQIPLPLLFGCGTNEKSVELEHKPRTWADIYCGMFYDDTEWYVKFFIENEGPVVEIWSMNWDGAVH